LRLDLRFEDLGGFTGEIDLNAGSVDTLDVQGDRRELGKGGWWNDEEKAVIIDLEDIGVKFKIRSVGFEKGASYVIYELDIPAPKEAGNDERWRLTYSLYHAKGNDTFTDCRNFNPSELIKYQGTDQTKRQTILVTSKAVAADRPKINIKVDSRAELKEDEDLDIRVDITDDIEPEDKIKYTLTRPDNSLLDGDKKCDDAGRHEKQCIIELSQIDLVYAGNFKIEVTAKDKDSQPNEEKNSRTFEVACIGFDYESYGLCRRERDGCDKRKIIDINDLSLSCTDDSVCCGFTGSLSVRE